MASSFLCGALLAAAAGSSALAQAPPQGAAAGQPAGGEAQPGGAGEVEAIVVTGSRIPQTNLTSVSPVQAVVSQEFQLQGRTNVIDLINTLPQTVQLGNADLSNTSNPLSVPGGVATVDLRGLGPQRTLVLVDGRRLGLGDPNTANPNPAPDINQIPAQLIDRVEVLTGGASAVYGSDAVAGVVNFIMKRNFSGVQLDLQWGTNNHHNDNKFMQGLERAAGIPVPKKNVWDGQSRDASVTFGVNSGDGRANLTGYLNYHTQDPVRFSRRDFAACQLQYDDVTDPASAFCAGSSSSNRFALSSSSSTAFAVVGNSFQPWDQSARTSPPPLFNSNSYEFLQHKDKRYSGGFFAHYDVNDNFNLYGEFAYMKDNAQTRIAPSGIFQGDGPTVNAGWDVNCNNPFLSAQQRGIIGCSAARLPTSRRARPRTCPSAAATSRARAAPPTTSTRTTASCSGPRARSPARGATTSTASATTPRSSRRT
jgi:outer membrane receptor protein involved in Fe transport